MNKQRTEIFEGALRNLFDVLNSWSNHMQTIRKILIFIVSIFKALLPKQTASAWWIRIKTNRPEYTYYFGPFEDKTGAERKQPGFIEDLQAEGAEIAQTTVLWHCPSEVTIAGNHVPA